MTEQTATGIDLVWAALIERAQTMHPDASRLTCDAYQYGVSSGVDRMQPEIERLSRRVAEQDALLTQAYASNAERQEELVQLDAALEQAAAERDEAQDETHRMATKLGQVIAARDADLGALRAERDRSAELLYQAAQLIANGVAFDDQTNPGQWDSAKRAWFDAYHAAMPATSTDPQPADEPALTATP